MDTLLLAAGRGTRLGTITKSTPKCLVKVAGRPLLDYWLEQLDSCTSINRVFVNTHYLSEHVHTFLKNSMFTSKVHIIAENRLWGTGGTLARLIEAHDVFYDGLLVAHADNLSLFKLDDFLQRHHRRPEYCSATVMTFDTDTPSSCGIFKLNRQQVVTEFFEKPSSPPGKLANGAVFAFSPDALLRLMKQFSSIEIPLVNSGEVFDLCRDFLPLLVGKLWTFHNDVYHRDIGTPASLAVANNDFFSARTQFMKGQVNS